MIARQQMQQNFDRASGQYELHAPLQQRWRREVIAALRPLMKADARVLDIGAGTGSMAAEAPWRMISLDLAFGMCRVAAGHGYALQADAQCLPLRDASVDAVASSLCLQWVEDHAAVFAEIARVLKPGGMAVIMTLGRGTLQELRALSDLRLLPMHALAHYVDATDAAGLEVISAEARLEIEGYASLGALLRSFRAIGAGAAFETRARAMGPAAFGTLQRAYAAQHPHACGIAATWEPMRITLRRRGLA